MFNRQEITILTRSTDVFHFSGSRSFIVKRSELLPRGILSILMALQKMKEGLLLVLQCLCPSSLSQLHDNETNSGQNGVLERRLTELLSVQTTLSFVS